MSDETATTFCSTCKQDVPSANMSMHTIHCQRFLTCCPHCKESVNKNLLDEHIEENHAKVKCDDCKENVEKMNMESHKETSCKCRTVKCPYCELSLPALDMGEHKDSCGSRTEECETCMKRILIKNLDYHISSGTCRPPHVTTPPVKNKETRNIEKLYPKYQSDQISEGYNQFLDSKKRFIDNPVTHFGGENSSSSEDEDDIGQPFDDFDPITPVVKSQTTNSLFARQIVFPRGKFNVSYTSSESKKFVAKPKEDSVKQGKELPHFGMPYSDDAEEGEEKFPYSELNETFLPCEFCNEQFPADAISFHQANCDIGMLSSWKPPEPLPFPSQSFQPSTPYAPFTNERSLYSPQDQATGCALKSKHLGEDCGPCEFCNELFPFDALGTHQFTCLENPINSFMLDPDLDRQRPPLSPPRTRPLKPTSTFSAPPQSTAPTAEANKVTNFIAARKTHKLAPSFGNKPAASSQGTTGVGGARAPFVNKETPSKDYNESSRSIETRGIPSFENKPAASSQGTTGLGGARAPFGNKTTLSKDNYESSPSIETRRIPKSAPSFENKPAASCQLGTTGLGARVKTTKSSLVDDSVVKKRESRKSKGPGERLTNGHHVQPVKHTPPKKYREVNQLGSTGSTRKPRDLVTDTRRKPYDSHFNGRNSREEDSQASQIDNFFNEGRQRGSGGRAGRSSSTGAPRSTRGGNRGYNSGGKGSTRGRPGLSRGSQVVTISKRQANKEKDLSDARGQDHGLSLQGLGLQDNRIATQEGAVNGGIQGYGGGGQRLGGSGRRGGGTRGGRSGGNPRYSRGEL